MNAHGWPFLIGRGHHTGYRTLLAPAPLLANGDHTVLADHIEPGAIPDRPTVTDLTTPTGRRITVVHATHQVTAADLGQTSPPRDEHGRPLHLLYGFVSPRAITPDKADLHTALTTALATYQTFLNNENGFATQAAKPFPLRSTLATPQPRRTAPLVAVALLVVLLAALWWVSLPDEPAPPRPVPTVTPPIGPCTPPIGPCTTPTGPATPARC